MRGKHQTTHSNLCNEVQNSQKKGGWNHEYYYNSNKLFTWEMNLGSMSARPRDLDLALAPARSGALSLSWPSARDILPITDLKHRSNENI